MMGGILVFSFIAVYQKHILPSVIDTAKSIVVILISITIGIACWIYMIYLTLPDRLKKRIGVERESLFILLSIISISITFISNLLLYVDVVSLLTALIILCGALVTMVIGIAIREDILFIRAISIALEYRKYKPMKTKQLINLFVAVFIILFVVIILYLLVVTFVNVALVMKMLKENIVIILVIMVQLLIVMFILFKLLSFIQQSPKTEKPFFRYHLEWNLPKIVTIMFSGVLASIFLMLLILTLVGILPYKRHVWDFGVLTILTALGPYCIYELVQLSKRKKIEAELPSFLNDLAESTRAGITLFNAIIIASRGRYGALTPEIKKMAQQLSWGISLREVLEMFSERVDTPLVKRFVSIVTEASRTGGNIGDVITACARDATDVKLLEHEQRTNMVMYLLVVYIAFGVFLLTAIVLCASFLPEFAKVGGIGKPGTQFYVPKINVDEYINLFYIGTLMQGFGGGIVAGLMIDRRFVTGLQHSLIMLIVGHIVFRIVIGL
jgi:flagellar protein FlaJ